MKASDIAKGVAWAAAGAAFMGGGVLLGRLSSLLVPPAKREREEPAGAALPSEPIANAEMRRRLDHLAAAITELQARVEEPRQAAARPDQIDLISRRVDQLEQRVEQMIAEAPVVPPVDQVLAAVEQMITARIGGLDERLTDQVHAIELLRSASSQTDALLQRLIHAVEALAAPAESQPLDSIEKAEAERAKEWDSPLG
jgi:hypothetical protein